MAFDLVGAALAYFVPIKDYVISKWIQSWNVNVHAPFVLSQLALGDMLGRPWIAYLARHPG